ncbi:bifunctional (p)ppGpp synthetase/guanosine-3',5'-bis(diphosphate) 3'-pyrophosphohydrolase [Moraxella sp. ZY210820]|uniref:RelA/SpoT family protein n=1 Tax=unclassified Moraxella TaxID=2685852 RepID=UPI0027304D53|nr:HD domain-containing protein [Moraxella sp. ZY210820]WLF84269.1 HD domain-containing protein [Moraxella sp. ZY210820]
MPDCIRQAKDQLKLIIEPYLPTDQVNWVMDAADFADKAHEGVTRKSGEPYILHPIAVTCLLANMRLDYETLMAGLMHDVIEDTPVTKEQMAEKYGKTTADLVDGVTKMSHSSDKLFNKALTFRKILQATLQDPRVIMVKLADRYHNMTTLDSLRPDKRARIAQETIDIYVPMARIVGMNDMADQLELLCYENLDLEVFNNIQNALAEAKPNRCQYQKQWEQALAHIFQTLEIAATIEKKDNKVELFRRFMRGKISLHELSHSHSFNVIVPTIANCDTLAEYLKQHFEVLFYADNIRHPLPGGNQSLRIKLKGEHTFLTLNIQTELMQRASQYGVVLGENAPQACRSAIQASMQNLNTLLDVDDAKTTFDDLLDYLHQDKIWVYTPQGHVHELPKGATAVDFAYAVSTFLGDHTVGAKIDKEIKPLSTPLLQGQTVEIIKDVLATPNPDWLSFVNTQKARRAIQNILKEQDVEEQRLIGAQALDRALRLFNRSSQDLTEQDWADVLQWQNIQSKQRLFEQIAIGDLLPQLVANRLFARENSEQDIESDRLIKGTEGIDVKYAQCCNPILGDIIQGNLTRRGLIVHRVKCTHLEHERSINPENIMPLQWNNEIDDVSFTAYLSIHAELDDEQVSRMIYQCRKMQIGVEGIYPQEEQTYAHLVVKNRNHLAEVMRELRSLLAFPQITRLKAPMIIKH